MTIGVSGETIAYALSSHLVSQCSPSLPEALCAPLVSASDASSMIPKVADFLKRSERLPPDGLI